MRKRRKLKTSLSLAAIAVLLLAPGYRPKAAAGSESVTFVFERGLDGFTAFEDTSIFSESQNSGGGTSGIFSGTILGGTDHRRALLWVDVSVIPEGAVIEQVMLDLVVDRSGGNSGNIEYTLHALLKDWGEGDRVGGSGGGQGAPAAPGDATWLSNFHQMELWENPGGDFDPEPSAIGTAEQERTFAVWTGPGMVADVQRWVDDPSTNFGWILISTEEGASQRVKRFSSSEALTNRPRLTVIATLPAGEGEGEGGAEGEGEGEGPGGPACIPRNRRPA
jgi:hypothetical protein